MTTLNPMIGAPLTKQLKWDAIKWNTLKLYVRRLQLRIAKATKQRRYGRIKALQWLLTHSFYAKLLAIKRVTQNRGKNILTMDLGGGYQIMLRQNLT